MEYYKMKIKQITLLGLFLFIIGLPSLDAQTTRDSITIWEITTKDGNIIKGNILSKTKDHIFVQTKSMGTLALSRKNIRYRRIYREKGLIDGKLLIDNYLANRNMMGPTGFNMKKGESYYENRYLFVNHVNFGLSDHFSLGVGIMPVLLIGAEVLPVWVVPKVSIPLKNEKFQLSVGLFTSFLLIDRYGDETTALISFLMGSYGDQNISFTVGLGYGRFDQEWMSNPAFIFSGNIRASQRTFINVEFIAVNPYKQKRYESQINLFTFGVRTYLRKIVVDYGIFIPRDMYDVQDNLLRPIPYLGLFIPIGKNKRRN